MLSANEILGPGGRIAARLPNYEHRREQLDMAEAVDRAIHERHHLVVEAGTGVGKSFAYLVPAILAAAGQQKSESRQSEAPSRRVVVSTHTISLQEQLIAEGPAAVAQRDSAGVFGRAGQGAGQLPQPAAAGQRPEPRRQPVPRPRGVRAVAAAPRLVAGDGRRLAFGPRFSPAAGRVGRGGQRSRQLHGPHVPDVRPSVSTTRPGGGCKTPKSWWSTTPCSSPTWRCGART